jgi:hypothetical protein
MGRKFNLQKKCLNILERRKEGSKSTKLERRRIMNSIINDLDCIRRLPSDIKLLNPTDIECLVKFWKSKNITVATICNKLGVFRHFSKLANLNIQIPSNKELGSIKPTLAKTGIRIPENYEQLIFHPITISVIMLQKSFGLTKLEAMRLNPIPSSNNNTLLIERSIAHNHKDRTVPILTEDQTCALTERELLIRDRGLAKWEISVPLINNLYIAECFHADISPKTPFRRIYAHERLKTLTNEQCEKVALLTLSKEMGLSETRKLLSIMT